MSITCQKDLKKTCKSIFFYTRMHWRQIICMHVGIFHGNVEYIAFNIRLNYLSAVSDLTIKFRP